MSTDSDRPKGCSPVWVLRTTLEPEAVASGKRVDEKVRATGPDNIFSRVGFVGHEAGFTLGAEAGGVQIANPPHKGRLRFGIAGVVIALELGHGVDGVVCGNVGVDDSVAKAFRGLFFQERGVGVDDGCRWRDRRRHVC